MPASCERSLRQALVPKYYINDTRIFLFRKPSIRASTEIFLKFPLLRISCEFLKIFMIMYMLTTYALVSLSKLCCLSLSSVHTLLKYFPRKLIRKQVKYRVKSYAEHFLHWSCSIFWHPEIRVSFKQFLVKGNTCSGTFLLIKPSKFLMLIECFGY